MSSRKKKLIVGATACFIVIVVAFLLTRWMNGSSNGSISTGKPAQTSQTTPSEPVAVKTSYFSTSLPPGYGVKRQAETPGKQTLLQLVAYGGVGESDNFGVTIGTLPSDGLSGVGDYNLRVKTTAYTPYSPPDLPKGATAFRTTTGAAAFTVFWLHGATYTEIALSSDGGSSLDKLESTFSQAMHNWQWQ